jgi:hypothetical protein
MVPMNEMWVTYSNIDRNPINKLDPQCTDDGANIKIRGGCRRDWGGSDERTHGHESRRESTEKLHGHQEVGEMLQLEGL